MTPTTSEPDSGRCRRHRRRRQTGGADLAHGGGQDPQAGRHPQGRPRRHPGPDGHRRPGGRRSTAPPGCSVICNWPTSRTTRPSCSAPRRPPTTPRATSCRTASRCDWPRDGGGDRGRGGGVPRGDLAGPVQGLRDQGRRAARVRTRPGRRGGRAQGPQRDRQPVRRGRRTAGAVGASRSTSRSTAPAAPTSAPWPATSAPTSASAVTSPRFAVPASALSTCRLGAHAGVAGRVVRAAADRRGRRRTPSRGTTPMPSRPPPSAPAARCPA